jgi:uncharacterized phage protein (TIGR01671 family)
MIYPDEKSKNGLFLIDYNGVPYFLQKTEEKIEIVAVRQRFEVMLWSGRQDKNGRDIYDGDIVELERYDQKIRGLVVVTVGDRYVVQLTSATDNYTLGDREVSVPITFYEWNNPVFDWEDLVIIGNKFENPQLLR